MKPNNNKKIEARRYRQQVMLQEIVSQSRKVKRADVEQAANRKLTEISKLDFTKNSSVAQKRLEELSKGTEVLAKRLEIDFSHKQTSPRWVRLAAIGVPVFFGLILGFWVIERRRRLKSLSKSEVKSFEETDK